MKTTCEFCHSNNCDFYELPFGFYDHVKFKKLTASNGKLAVCSDCGAVGNVCDESLHQSIATRFRGNEYFATKKTDFHLSVPEFDGMVSPYFLLARAISQVLGKFHPRVLDIGCLDGKLLLELERAMPGKRSCVGFDLSNHANKIFPRFDNFRLILRDFPKNIGKFDLIIFNNSIQYIYELRKFMDFVAGILSENGAIVIRVPDMQMNPLTMAFGDQYWNFNWDNMETMLSYSGLSFSAFPDHYSHWFSRSIVGYAKFCTNQGAKRDAPNAHVLDALDYLQSFPERLKAAELKVGTCKNLYVLGTSLNAAISNSLLERGADGFVDENPAKLSGPFLGKPVIHPKDMTANDVVLLPYGNGNAIIAEKFRSAYSARVIDY